MNATAKIPAEALQIKGRLEYLRWDCPWTITPVGELTAELGPVDISPLFWAFAQRHKDKLCSHHQDRASYELKADTASEFNLEFEKVGWGIGLFMTEQRFGFSNVAAYLESTFCRLNARHVIFEPRDDSFKIWADPEHQVFGVKYHGSGNYAQVPEGKEREICKVGTTDACLFAMCGAGGFECAKFSGPTARLLLDRKVKGTIRATRIGDCECTGRVDS
jgi:hypothetical protein